MTKDSIDGGAFSRRSFLKGASAAAVGSAALHANTDARQDGPKTLAPGALAITLAVNGKEHTLQAETRTTLLDALRDKLDLTGAKKGCDRGACGGCTVHVDGLPVNSCLMLAVDAQGAQITTVEGIGKPGQDHPLVEEFARCDAMQCGFCTPGMVMAAADLLAKSPKPSEAEIRSGLKGNICRCTGYHNIVKAVQIASGQTV